MQQCSQSLTAYQYETEYRKLTEYVNVAARLVPMITREESETKVYVFGYADELLITAGDTLCEWPGTFGDQGFLLQN